MLSCVEPVFSRDLLLILITVWNYKTSNKNINHLVPSNVTNPPSRGGAQRLLLFNTRTPRSTPQESGVRDRLRGVLRSQEVHWSAPESPLSL